MADAKQGPDREIARALHRQRFTARQKAAIVVATMLVIVVLSLMPQGSGEGKLHGQEQLDPHTGESRFVETTAWQAPVALWTGVIAGYILLVSPLTGHRPLLRRWLRGRTWTTVHTTIGILILISAGIHAVALISIGAFYTWPSGTAAMLVLALHGASAAFKTRLVAQWGVRRWRTLHIATGWIGLTVGLQHALGTNAAAELWT